LQNRHLIEDLTARTAEWLSPSFLELTYFAVWFHWIVSSVGCSTPWLQPILAAHVTQQMKKHNKASLATDTSREAGSRKRKS